MAIALVTVGGKVTASTTNAEIVQINTQGLTGIVPTSVAGAGVSVGAAGKVTFAAATSVSINGCFTTTYDNYRVVFEVSSASAAISVNAVLRAAGTDSTTANYDVQVIYGTAATAAAATAFAGANWGVSGAAATGTIHDIAIELKRPFLAQATFGTAISAVTQNPATAPSVSTRVISNRLTSSFDGITFNITGGNGTGVVRIYGWNNN